MLLQFPTNVTAWICHTLVTSSLLKVSRLSSRHYLPFSQIQFCFLIMHNSQAVGVGSFSGSTAAASAAAIRWVLVSARWMFNFMASHVQVPFFLLNY